MFLCAAVVSLKPKRSRLLENLFCCFRPTSATVVQQAPPPPPPHLASLPTSPTTLTTSTTATACYTEENGFSVPLEVSCLSFCWCRFCLFMSGRIIIHAGTVWRHWTWLMLPVLTSMSCTTPLHKNPRQVSHTSLPLLLNGIIWYWQKLGSEHWTGRSRDVLAPCLSSFHFIYCLSEPWWTNVKTFYVFLGKTEAYIRSVWS